MKRWSAFSKRSHELMHHARSPVRVSAAAIRCSRRAAAQAASLPRVDRTLACIQPTSWRAPAAAEVSVQSCSNDGPVSGVQVVASEALVGLEEELSLVGRLAWRLVDLVVGDRLEADPEVVGHCVASPPWHTGG